ncbi:MAG: uncharacterized protein KVP18_004413 [Porospora cf. gigantea A]|uniref:uncharacterized protein n=1 Tax=Porospora cf. gigantea A TaxID=2853593 RepID=UPI00355964A3|nr:MAG: hypothetical protein KVP18_004413 [Porospora cf. gigantea A]
MHLGDGRPAMEVPPPRNRAKVNHIIAFCSAMMAAGMAMSCLLVQNVFQSVMSVMTAQLKLDFSLFDVQASGDCFPLWGIYTKPNVITKFCYGFLRTFDGLSIGRFVDISCSATSIFWWLQYNACDNAWRVAFHSYAMITGIILCAVLYMASAIGVLLYHTTLREKSIRDGVLVLQYLGTVFFAVPFTMFSFCNGFFVDLTLIPFFVTDVSGFDLGPGYFLLVAVFFFLVLIPLASTLVLPSWATSAAQQEIRQRAEGIERYRSAKSEQAQVMDELRRLL